MPKFHSQDFLQADQLQALGLIVSEWSMLMAYLQVAIWRLLDLDRKPGLIVTADQNAVPLIDTFHALCVERFANNPDALREADELYERLKDYNTERNNLAHNIWAIKAQSRKLESKKFTKRGGKLKEIELSMNPQDLIRVARHVGVLMDEVDDFRQRYVGALPPSQTKSTPQGSP